MMSLPSHWPQKHTIWFRSSLPNKWNCSIDDTVGIIWYWGQHQGHYMIKHYAAHCCNHLDLMRTVVLMIRPLAWHDADASVKWLKKSCCIISVILNWQIQWCYWWWSSVSCDANIGITWPKKSFCAMFQSSWPNKHNGAIENAISTMWCWHWCQQHHLSRRVKWHLVSIVSTKWTKWYHVWSQHHMTAVLVPLVSHNWKGNVSLLIFVT